MPSKKQRAKAAAAAAVVPPTKAVAAAAVAPPQPRTLAQMVRAEGRAANRKLSRNGGVTIHNLHTGCLGENVSITNSRTRSLVLATGKEARV